jgi:hypothetical protein
LPGGGFQSFFLFVISGLQIHSTWTLTAGVDALVGTANNDTFVGDFVVNSATGALTVPTLGAFDTIDGGAGIDTLRVTDTTNAAFTLPTGGNIKNVEVVSVNHSATAANQAVTADVSTYAGLQAVNIVGGGTAADATVTTKSNATSVSVNNGAVVQITDTGTAATTADKLASVSLTGTATSAVINSDALTSLSLTNTAIGATVNAAAGARALSVSLNGVTGGTVADAEATTLNVTSAGTATTGVTLNAAKATTVTVDSGVATTITDMNVAAATTLTVKGAGNTTISGLTTVTALTSVDASGAAGNVTITPVLGTGVTFTGGAGKDAIAIGATTKAITTGAGDDTVTMSVAVATGGSVNAGNGTDTLAMAAADAATATSNDTFAKGITGFEQLQLTTVATGNHVINMANLAGINYVKTAGTSSVVAVSEVQTVAVTGAATGQVSFLGTAVATSANADTAAATVTKILGDKVNIMTVWNAANPTLELQDITAGATAADLTLTYKNTEGNVAVINTAGNAGITFGTSVETTAGVAAVPGGTFSINNLLSGGTFELTSAITGASSISIKDAASNSSDVLNFKLNGAFNIASSADLTVANVETINITTADTTTASNPAAASVIRLAAADATIVTVTGNHGVDFTNSTLTKVATLDASGVVGTGVTAAAAATAGAVTFVSAITNANVSIKGGNGNDTLSAVNLSDATKVATIDGGAGNDIIIGGAGKDVLSGAAGNDTITGGAGADTLSGGLGNDTFVYASAAQSTLANMDIISDFVANTFGNGASGAAGIGAGAAASRTGDVIQLNVAAAAAILADGVVVGVQSSAADAQTFLQNLGNDVAGAVDNAVGVALDSSSSKLYIDLDSNGTVDSVIQLTGITTITAAAFVLV